jgi:hypothetical protein
MVTPRRVIALPTDAEQRQRLLEISRSRTEPTNRVERTVKHEWVYLRAAVNGIVTLRRRPSCSL